MTLTQTIILIATVAVAAVLLVPVVVFSLECLVACAVRRKRPGRHRDSDLAADRIAVVIPAHNEQGVISQTLATVRPQLRDTDTLIVVADNCTDGTAAEARAAGATVLERNDAVRRGKGYALDYGIRSLDADPPHVVVLVDADCDVHPGSVAILAAAAARTGRPCQAVYLMETPPDPSPTDRISAFAFRVKNLVRPLGLRRLGMPCLLTGTGMAFPWAMVRNAPLASGNIVEDMQLGLDLTIAGTPPLLCPDAEVTGRLPQQRSAATSQRTRWEHGHMHTIKTQVPRLLFIALTRFSPRTLAVALELAVPPLSLLVAAWTAVSVAIAAIALVFHLWIPLAIIAAGWLLLSTAVLSAWTRFGRDILPFGTLARIPLYIARKLPLYKAFFGRRRETNWVRTARDTAAPATLAPETPAQQIADHLLADAAARDTSLGLGHDPNTDLPHRVGRARVAIGQTLIDNLTMDEAIESIEALIRRRRPTYVVTPNVDHVVKLQSQPAFRNAYRDAGLVLADGMPLLWAARLLRTPLKQKVSGSDLFPKFCDVAGRKGYRLFFLGGRPGAAEAAAAKFRAQHPNLQIACYCPPMGFEKDPAENRKAIDAVRAFCPDVLFVGLGAPKQEHWMHRHHADCGASVSIGIGGSFEFVAGYVRRAPVVLQKLGIEWTWRLLCEPRRMYRRYLIEDPQFLSIVWRQWRVSSPSYQFPMSRSPVPVNGPTTTIDGESYDRARPF